MTITEIVKFCKSALRVVLINSNHLCRCRVIGESLAPGLLKSLVTHLSFFPEALEKERGRQDNEVFEDDNFCRTAHCGNVGFGNGAEGRQVTGSTEAPAAGS
jgi:hypothetical protein